MPGLCAAVGQRGFQSRQGAKPQRQGARFDTPREVWEFLRHGLASLTIDPQIIRENYLARKYAGYGSIRAGVSLPERVSQATFRGRDGRNLKAALEVGERSLRAIRPAQSRSQSDREEFRQSVHAAEQREYLAWAKASRLFIDEPHFDGPWRAGGQRGESEHQIYFDEPTQRWWKRNLLNFHDGSISAYLERLAAQKLLFPEMAMKFEGFTTFQNQVAPIVSQPDAQGGISSDENIVRHLSGLGFVEVFETGRGMSRAHQLAVEAGLQPPSMSQPRRIGFLLPSEGIWLEDVHEENAVCSTGGLLEVFDPVLYFVNAVELPLA